MSDCELSERGIRQTTFKLTQKARDIASIGGKRIETLFCSPLKRAVRTALAFPHATKIILIPGLAEVRTSTGMNYMQMVEWLTKESIDISKFDFTILQEQQQWEASKETKQIAEQRIYKALQIIKKMSKTNAIGIVSHKNTINMCLGRHTYPFKKRKEINPPLPHGWGSRQGFPANFKPLRVCFRKGNKHLVPALTNGNIMLIRHAHSQNNEKRRKKKRRKIE
jgi:broad specificity phosphatase PhoE